MELFYATKSALRRMPAGLRNITCLCLVFTLFLPAAFLPFGERSIDGVHVSFTAFWDLGGGPLCAGIGIVSAVLAYGFIRARRWVRPIVVGPGCVLAILILLKERRVTFDLTLVVLTLGVVPIWYFYFRHSVRTYFAPEHGQSEN
jgi:hypothetical protein